jgi:plastocyanin
MARNRGVRSGRGGWKLDLVACAIVAGPALGFPATTVGDTQPAQILIQSFRFDPPTLSVPVGATVIWTNHDEEIHSLVSSPGGFSSPGLDSDEQFSYRFEQPGIYEYRCGLHPQMKGTIVVLQDADG